MKLSNCHMHSYGVHYLEGHHESFWSPLLHKHSQHFGCVVKINSQRFRRLYFMFHLRTIRNAPLEVPVYPLPITSINYQFHPLPTTRQKKIPITEKFFSFFTNYKISPLPTAGIPSTYYKPFLTTETLPFHLPTTGILSFTNYRNTILYQLQEYYPLPTTGILSFTKKNMLYQLHKNNIPH